MDTTTTGPTGPVEEDAVEVIEAPTAATGPTAEVVAAEEVDYKAELEASQEREAKAATERDNYRKGLLIAKGKREDDGSLIVTDKVELEKMIDERATRIAKATVATVAPNVDALIAKLSANPDEQKLIKHIYETRISHTGDDAASIESDLEEAHLLANKKTVKKTISELKVAAKGRATPGSGAGSSTAQSTAVGDQTFTPAQLADLKKRGIDPEKVRSNLGKIPGFPNK